MLSFINKKTKPVWVKIAIFTIIAILIVGMMFYFRHFIVNLTHKFLETQANSHNLYILVSLFDAFLIAYFLRARTWFVILPLVAIIGTSAAHHYIYPRPDTDFLLNSGNFQEYISFIASTWLGSTVVAAGPLSVFAVLSLFIRIFRIRINEILRKCIPLATTALCIVYALYSGLRQPPFKYIEIKSSKVTEALDGYRIVQLSDMHLDSRMKTRHFKKTIDRVNALEADLILITGDIIDPGFDMSEASNGFFKSLKAKDGVYAVLGNHDKDLYSRTKGKIELKPLLQRLELTTLCCTTSSDYDKKVCGNDSSMHKIISKDDDGYDAPLCIDKVLIPATNPKFRLTGIDDIADRKSRSSKITKAFKDWENDMKNKELPEIVMFHRPLYYKSIEARRHPLLVLSGHTHRGQIYQLYKRNKFQYFYGHHIIGKSHFYITSGTDGKGPRMRFFAPSEIPVITLRKTRK